MNESACFISSGDTTGHKLYDGSGEVVNSNYLALKSAPNVILYVVHARCLDMGRD